MTRGLDVAATLQEELNHTGYPARVFCARDLANAAKRKEVSAALRAGKAALIAPRVYATPTALAFAMASVPWQAVPPHMVAVALARQNGWTLGLPLEMARFLLMMAIRPEECGEIPYDQGTARTYSKIGLTLIPASPSRLDLSVAGQALATGLPIDCSGEGLSRIGRYAAFGTLGADVSVGDLADDLAAGRLSEPAAIAAGSLVEAVRCTEMIADRQAPPDFVPPETAQHLEGWEINGDRGRDGVFREWLRAASWTMYPGGWPPNRLRQSSPLVWIDEGVGYARTVSRVYRLGERRW
ncbi:hypothetical protein ACMS1Z_13455 [Acidiphilium multivorum]|uniref:hypothetical protein n=1 Tax=Acidiphilium multivorum TaxID=62140 RepID=UPI0039C963EC